MIELTKSQKRIARKVIEMGLQREYVHGLKKAESVLSGWKTGKLPDRDAYMKLYQDIRDHDKIIGRRYNKVTGSRYLLTIASQLADDIISIDELSEFDDEVQQKIILISGIHDEK